MHVPRLFKNHTNVTYQIINLHTKDIVLIRDIIWLDKTHRYNVSIKENTKANAYIIQDEDESYNWAHVKPNPVNIEVITGNVQKGETLRPSRIIEGKNKHRIL